MKKLIFIVSVLLLAHAAQSQIFSWGIKGGLNSSKVSFDDFSVDQPPTVKVDPARYGEIANILADNTTTDAQKASLLANPDFYTITAPKVSFEPSSYDFGYHFGAFARFKVLGIFIQPELIFSQTKTTINIQNEDAENIANSVVKSAAEIKYTNFDIPVMVGVKFGPARLYGGPVATFKLGNKADKSASAEVNEMLTSFTAVTQKATFGGQAGVGLDILKKVTLDVRYEFALSKLGDNISAGGESCSTDQRQSQFIASIGWIF
ncbi:MAG: porin family protein [Salinivirgaceae bacterium]